MSEGTTEDRPDLRAATDCVAEVVRQVRDDQLDAPTPCDYPVAALLEHLAGLAAAFTAAARHEDVPGGDAPPPSPDPGRLDPEFRSSLPVALEALAEAWSDAAAWGGLTRAGGVEMPGEVAGLVALDEVVVHGWDVAVATGQRYEPPRAALEGALAFVAQSVEESPEGTPGLFARPVPVPDDAPLLDRLIGLTGRDPRWVRRS